MLLPFRQSSRLLAGRCSQPGAIYFVTWCTYRRHPYFAQPEARARMLTTLQAIAGAHEAQVLAGTVMPDHVHVLFILGDRLTLGQAVGKTKAAGVRQVPTLRWQRNFFERRLRQAAEAEDYALYIFMNPYCARLVPLGEAWPGWFSPQAWRFSTLLEAGGLPPPEWLGQAQRFGQALPPGAG